MNILQKKLNPLKKNGLTFIISNTDSGKHAYVIVIDINLISKNLKNETSKNKFCYDVAKYISAISLINNQDSPVNQIHDSSTPFNGLSYSMIEGYIGCKVANSLFKTQYNDYTLIVENISRLKAVLVNERQEMEKHKDCLIFLNNIYPALRAFLINISSMLGHISTEKEGSSDEFIAVSNKLKEMQLDKWLPMLAADLFSLSNKIKYLSNIRTKILNISIERVFFYVNILISHTGNGYTCTLLPSSQLSFWNQNIT